MKSERGIMTRGREKGREKRPTKMSIRTRASGGEGNMGEAVGSWSPCPVPLLRLVLSMLLFFSPLSTAAEDAGDALVLNSHSKTTFNSNSTAGVEQFPAVSLSLSLGISQELNPNPFIHPNPMLSLSLSLSVSEELRGNPFDLVNLLPPPPQPADQGLRPQQQQPQQQQRQPAEERHLPKEGSASQAERSAVGRGKCPYTVIIKTSCSSPRVTRDAISLAFGDAYHNEVYAARLDDPASGTFERCSIDTFRVVGPCGSRTCYLHLRRSGRDGWTPEYAKVFYNLNGDSRAAVSFPYDVPLPDGFWYGFNICHDGLTAALPQAATAVHSAGPTKSDGDKDDDKGNNSKEDGSRNDDDDDGGDGGDPTINLKTRVGGSVRTVIFKI